MEKINFYLINASIVPDIYKKVITAKSLLASGKAKSASQAAKMAEQSDGAIVGSAIVKLCARYGKDCVPYVKEYVKSMKDAIKK